MAGGRSHGVHAPASQAPATSAPRLPQASRLATPTTDRRARSTRPRARSPGAKSSPGATSRRHRRLFDAASISTGTPGGTPIRRGCASGAGRRTTDACSGRAAEFGLAVDITELRLMTPMARRARTCSRRSASSRRTTETPTTGRCWRVTLPHAVAPGRDRSSCGSPGRRSVPRTFARTGVIGNYFFIAQWFPKLGVLEDDGWNCAPVPRRHRVLLRLRRLRRAADGPRTAGSSAPPASRRSRTDDGDGTTTHRYVQDDVHDFAWTTSPDFVERTRTVRASEAAAGGDAAAAAAGARRPGRPPLRRDGGALQYYGEWFGAYPYGHITIVDPAWQSDAGGMEYPTLFTAGTRWLAPAAVDDARRRHRRTKPATSSGTASSATTSSSTRGWTKASTRSRPRARWRGVHAELPGARFFGGFIPWVFRDIPLQPRDRRNRLTGYRRAAEATRQSTPSYRYWPVDRRRITYNKTALWLHTLERWLGWPALQRIMSTYFERSKFKHPTARTTSSRRERGRAGGPDLVLRSGLSQLERLRLRRRTAGSTASPRADSPSLAWGAAGTRRRRTTPCSAPRCGHAWARRRSRLTCSSPSRTANRCARVGRPGPLAALHVREAHPCRVGAGGSGAGAAARRELHQQQHHAAPAGRRSR